MRSTVTIAACLAFVSLNASASPTTSTNCKGSSNCKNLSVASCDAAERTIVASNTYGTNGAKGNTGVCNGNCGIFVQGSNCAYSGQDLINAYSTLRAAGCQKCGSEVFDNGCEITINYVTGC
ncbi:hypothetical protein PILCRDRAFT_811004 [Piloderma croceum F 1598]|uniref:Killer toxin Kp4 domain-containing protein n=1 Tax=Piloderma croceum (strain F 1598) TaxID=765440 RepID=A0A0C3G657_PILCF|nr:hypothetical protein PILCRDRAFT_811004 [Piloderma croceum F 1598]